MADNNQLTNTRSEECDTEEAIMKELIPKPRTKSDLWKYFGLNPDSHGNMARNSPDVYCKTCRRKVQVKNRNTSNQKAYLKNNHKAAQHIPSYSR
uniref:BED-type domain-containing protein n=1 Tax=Amphimedon queenslandica TaxID=400682 RepID=A0A1X7VA27_AMPQE